MVPPLLARIQPEEALPRSQFSGDYDTYQGRTRGLIPSVY
jgi:protein-S-isoprenylcysteine O-methyltransferase Ste14